MPTGFEGLEQGANQLGKQSQGLRAAVDNGELVMDPEAAKNVAKVYEDKADDMRKQLRDARQLVRNNVFGNCEIGKQLEQKFKDKVSGGEGDSGVLPILRKMEQTLRDMAKAYQDSAREMSNADDENASALNRHDV